MAKQAMTANGAFVNETRNASGMIVNGIFLKETVAAPSGSTTPELHSLPFFATVGFLMTK